MEKKKKNNNLVTDNSMNNNSMNNMNIETQGFPMSLETQGFSHSLNNVENLLQHQSLKKETSSDHSMPESASFIGASSQQGRHFHYKQRTRRSDMRTLFCTLNSVLPTDKKRHGILNRLDETMGYICRLKERKRELESEMEIKEFEMILKEKVKNAVNKATNGNGDVLPCVRVREIGNLSYEVLINGIGKGFPMSIMLKAVQETGASVVSASLSSASHLELGFISILCKFADGLEDSLPA